MRFFLGIELPPEMKEYIASSLIPVKMKEKGWELPHDFHLTLLFIGAVTSEKIVEDIKRRMEGIRFASFEIKLSHFEFFPRRVLYLGLHPSLVLMNLRKQIKKLYPEWAKEEREDFVPHITVKRWQRYEYQEIKHRLEQHLFVPKKFKVSEIALFKSEKDIFNRKYHVVHRSTDLS